MKVNFKDSCCEKEIEVKAGKSIEALISDMKLNDETFIIKLNNRIAHETEQLKEGDKLEFVSVIYGG